MSATYTLAFGDKVDTTPSGESLSDPAVERQLRIRIEADLDRLAHLKLVDVGLVDPGAHPHRLRIDHIDDGHAGAHFLAFLDLGLAVRFPHHPEHRHPADRRDDGHALGVGLGLPHRDLGAVAADLEDLAGPPPPPCA